MKFSAFCLALVFGTLTISQLAKACVVQNQPSMTNLSLSVTETFEWDLQTLIQGTNLTYSLSPSDSQFWIQKPISLLGTPNPHVESINKVVGAKALMENNGRTWKNSFVFIESELGTLDLFLSDQTQGDTAAPSFNLKVSVALNNTYINCYGVDYITYSLFILDCIDTTKLPFDNVFLIQPRSGLSPQQFKNQNINQYKYISKRILQSIKILEPDSEDEETYIFRSTPAYAAQDGKIETSSILEVFVIGDLNEPILLTVLDSKMLGQLLHVSYPESFKFSLIDFKVFSDGRVYILTSNQGIYILQFLVKGVFEFDSQIYETNDLAYAFGIGNLERSIYNTGLISVLYKDHARIINYQTILKIPIDYNANYQDVISFSGNFLVIQSSGTTYLYDPENFDKSEYLYRGTLEGVVALFIHSIKPEIIVITQIDSRRYELSNGFLKFNGIKEQNLPKTVNLIATDQNESCKKIIQYQVFGSEDVSIKQIQELEFPQPLYDTPSPFYIQSVASGPNQNYFKAYPQDFNIEIIKFTNITVNSLDVSSQQNIQFAKIVADDINHFVLVTQNTSNVVFINMCTYEEKYSSYASCVLFKPYQSIVQLTKSNFDLLFDNTQIIYHVTLDTDYLATIRISQPKGILDSFQISYNNVLIYKISSVTFIQSGICFLLKNSNYIDIWQNKGPATLLLRIDKYTFWELRYFEQLKLQKVVGYQDRQLMFIINNKKDVIVADLLEEFRILKVISFETGEIEVVLGENTFFIIYQSLNQSIIKEYSFDDFGTIHFQKNLPTYDYILQSPLDVEFTQTGTLLVKATNKNKNNAYILIYEPYQNYRDALQQIIQLEEITPSLISASGRNQQIIYINHNGQYQIKSFFSGFLVKIKPIYIPNSQFLIKNVNFKVHNIISNTSILLNSTAKFVNTFVNIKINSTYINEYPLIVNDYEVKVFQFQSELLFNGFCSHLTIICEQCNTRMEFTPIVQKLDNDKFNSHYIINAVSFVDQYSIFLDDIGAQSIYIVDEEDNIITNYSLNSYSCKEISSTIDGKFIFTACSNRERQSYIHIANCIKTDTLECHPYGAEQYLGEIQRISQLIVQGEYVFVGQQANTFLTIYKWKDLGDHITFELIEKYESQQFPSLQLNIQSFQIFNHNQNLKILLLDETKYIITLDAVLNNELVFSSDYSVFDLKSFLDEENSHIYPQYEFIQVEELYPSHFNEQEQTFTIYIIVISNKGHYAIELTHQLAILTEIKLLYTLSQFSNSKVQNKASIGYGFLAVFYLVPGFKSNLIVYSLPQLPLSEKSVFYGIGGTPFLGRSSLTPIFYFFSNKNTLKVFDIYEAFLVNYKINPQYQIKVDNSDNGLYEEDIQINFYNSLKTEKAIIKLKRSENNSSQQVTD